MYTHTYIYIWTQNPDIIYPVGSIGGYVYIYIYRLRIQIPPTQSGPTKTIPISFSLVPLTVGGLNRLLGGSTVPLVHLVFHPEWQVLAPMFGCFSAQGGLKPPVS